MTHRNTSSSTSGLGLNAGRAHVWRIRPLGLQTWPFGLCFLLLMASLPHPWLSVIGAHLLALAIPVFIATESELDRVTLSALAIRSSPCPLAPSTKWDEQKITNHRELTLCVWFGVVYQSGCGAIAVIALCSLRSWLSSAFALTYRTTHFLAYLTMNANPPHLGCMDDSRGTTRWRACVCVLCAFLALFALIDCP